jgi:flavin reductase (DIM6/NTAB) family NADH-FMN oxidoreductase RutF
VTPIDLMRLTFGPLPEWAPVGLPEGPGIVHVRLRAQGESLDVSGNHVIASLLPLTIAIGHDGIESGELDFIDRDSGRALGTLRLQRARAAIASEAGCSLLEVVGGRHWCLPAGLRRWQRLLQAKWKRAPGFHMANAAIQQLMLFYLLPRPVALVSVDDGANHNLFPMDLIGPLRDGFTLALRNTSPSVTTMRGSRRVALSDVALRLQPTVYQLGKHHRVARIDWAQLPFPAAQSPQFGLTVPADAQRLREFVIDDWRELGSHTFFRCRQVSDQRLGDEPRLHHTCGLHRDWRQRRGPLPWLEYAGAG